MVRYRRNFVPGGTYFFTVTLADRTSSTIVNNLGALRMAFRIARHERPFTIDAIVILPEHLHAIWTLPSGDSDFSGRWKRIKAHFTHRLVTAGVSVKRHRNGEYALWQRRFWEHTIRNETDFERHVDYVHLKEGMSPDFASLHPGYLLLACFGRHWFQFFLAVNALK